MKSLISVASFISILSISIQLSSPCAYAAGKVNCDQVMSEINSGKTVAEVAKDMGVSKRSVTRCRRHYPEGESKMGALWLLRLARWQVRRPLHLRRTRARKRLVFTRRVDPPIDALACGDATARGPDQGLEKKREAKGRPSLRSRIALATVEGLR